MNCLIIEDEPVAAGIIENYIRRTEGLRLAGSCRNAAQGLQFLEKHPGVDLIFLDIEMPGMSGLGFIKSLSDPPKVIITTAYREFAVEGFELNAADYLLKPIRYERFQKAVEKVNSGRPEYWYVKSGNKTIRVNLHDVLYIEGMGNYVKLALADQSSIVTYQRLGDLEKQLPAPLFIRIHRSYIVGVRQVESFGASSVLIGRRSLPVGGQYRENLDRFLAGLP